MLPPHDIMIAVSDIIVDPEEWAARGASGAVGEMVYGEGHTNDATPDYRVQEEMVGCYDIAAKATIGKMAPNRRRARLPVLRSIIEKSRVHPKCMLGMAECWL